jgi:hypothetical protein
MKSYFFTTHVNIAVLLFGLVALAPSSQAESQAGPFGGGGGGDFRIVCEPGEFVVGIDAQISHVVDRIAPVCGSRGGGTYGRPQAGTGEGKFQKMRCPGTGLLTILHVFVDAGPLVTNVGMSCWNPFNGDTANKVLRTGGVPVNDERFNCQNGEVAIGIFGRAGTAVDSLGLICDKWQIPGQ